MPLPALLASIAGTSMLSNAFGTAKTIAIEAAKWVAFKGLVYLVLFTVIPVLLYNIATRLIFDFMDYGLDYIATSGFDQSGLIIQFTGIGGWIVQTIQLPQCVSIFMSAIAVRFVLNFLKM